MITVKRMISAAAILAMFTGAAATAELALDGSVVSGGADSVRAPFGGIVEEPGKKDDEEIGRRVRIVR